MYKDILDGVYSGVRVVSGGMERVVSNSDYLNQINTIGASGICFGLLLAFGMMFPNNYIYLYFFVPIKCKYFVIGYVLLELFNGVLGTADGVAHFAHLGGALAGLFLVLYWRKKRPYNG
ncbi:MAG: rhomboid family intramembrane serine protease [Bacteroidota bacterium]|nr:rhomboid family intramembrane serine protease [Bacteroidota bacterium]